jgi:hypothetical protein
VRESQRSVARRRCYYVCRVSKFRSSATRGVKICAAGCLPNESAYNFACAYGIGWPAFMTYGNRQFTAISQHSNLPFNYQLGTVLPEQGMFLSKPVSNNKMCWIYLALFFLVCVQPRQRVPLIRIRKLCKVLVKRRPSTT